MFELGQCLTREWILSRSAGQMKNTPMSMSTSIEGKNIRVHGGGGTNNFLCFKRSPYDGQYGLGTCPDQDLQPTLRFERDPFSGKYFLVDANRGGIYAWEFTGHDFPNLSNSCGRSPSQTSTKEPLNESPSQYTMNQGLPPILPSTPRDTRTENP